MDSLRLLIREKLTDGRLPSDPMPRVWGGPGHGETCGACDAKVEKPQLVIEGLTEEGLTTFFHTQCFYVWEQERGCSIEQPPPRPHGWALPAPRLG